MQASATSANVAGTCGCSSVTHASSAWQQCSGRDSAIATAHCGLDLDCSRAWLHRVVGLPPIPCLLLIQQAQSDSVGPTGPSRNTHTMQTSVHSSLTAFHLPIDCPCADYKVVRRPGKSRLIFTTPLNFAEARKRCLREGADLVSTSSLAENQELNSAARGAGTVDFWVGLVSKTGLRTTKRADWMWLST